MVARTLKLNEIVYIVDEWTLDVIKGRITAIDFMQKDMHFSGDELNVDVEVEITEVLSEPCDMGVKEHIHVSNQNIYQIVPDKHYHGDEVCYECNPDEYRGNYYAPITNDTIDEEDFDENQTENGQYTKEQILDMCECIAEEYADGYDYETDMLRNAVIYGIQWALGHLKQ